MLSSSEEKAGGREKDKREEVKEKEAAGDINTQCKERKS